MSKFSDFDFVRTNDIIVSFRYMADRKPYDLKQIIKVYNIFQVVACSWLVMKVKYFDNFFGQRVLDP